MSAIVTGTLYLAISHPRSKAENCLKIRILQIQSFEQREQLSLRNKKCIKVYNVCEKRLLCLLKLFEVTHFRYIAVEVPEAVLFFRDALRNVRVLLTL